ncbi:MAG: hypothetical protein POG24_02630 [Acidocella sp.]|nr:hypothetical protein [Acidocella sp.]
MATPIRALRPVTKRGFAPSPWLAVAAGLAEAAFETDIRGHFTAFGDEQILGFHARNLLGTTADSLFNLSGGRLAGIFANLAGGCAAWHGRLTIRHADHTTALYRLALAPRASRYFTAAGICGLLINLDGPDHTLFPTIPLNAAVRPLCSDTGLWPLASFIEQAARRFDRLDVEDRPGTLILLGFGVAEAALHTPIAISIAEELREIIRPTDLLGRIAPAIIGLWCDGMDHLTGAERATRLCKYLPTATPGQSLISLGLATRWPGSTDDPETLLTRAMAALQKAEAITVRDNTASWHVWQGHHKA